MVRSFHKIMQWNKFIIGLIGSLNAGRIDKGTWFCFSLNWYFLVLVTALETLLYWVSLNRIQSSYYCSMDIMDRLIGFNKKYF